ncbi:vWA domain-containing protein [Chondromyces crocatus]|uniref:von Willebrand factor A n=1 Tax=Chondromyces crocatus TaxID=52 RepID=A0A0K1EQL0_CHOCO|nr:von Willebrand factor type A domain-containing protein [Chondromyces crocatus]AKT43121.1 von Willebrand factor A [Chondromyces crocatus]
MRARTVKLVVSTMIPALLAGCGAAPEKSFSASPSSPESGRRTTAGAAVSASDMLAAPEQVAMADESSVSVAAAPAPPAPPPPPPAQAPSKVAKEDARRLEGPQEKSAAEAKLAAAPVQEPGVVAAPPPETPGREGYTDYGVNPFTDPLKDRFSTFAVDVDTASYAISRRKIMEGTLPPFQAVRAEEFLNYFQYGYVTPKSGPFAVHLTAAPSPYTQGHHLLRVAVQGKRISSSERKPVHLVYLVDTSGSMESADKMGLAKKSLRLLTDSLRKGDTVALCTYAGSVREVLAPTGIEQRSKILAAIDDLSASGSTAMSSGIDLAYNLAQRTLVPGHVNRVMVLSDGDANVGATSHQEILKTIKHARDKGITLSTIGFGMGNYQDTMMERLANEGNGNYYYIDSETQARRVFSEQIDGTLEVIARDVKIQVEIDPDLVKTYRLIGYENRDVADKDFRNDKVDAGEIGSGHSVTAFYELELRSGKVAAKAPVVVRLRHKTPLGSDKADETLVRMDPSAMASSFEAAPANFRFGAAVAGFAEILRQSPHARSWKLAEVERIAVSAAGQAQEQQEFINLVRRAGSLSEGRGGALVAK